MTVIKTPDELITVIQTLVTSSLKKANYNDAYIALHLKTALRQYRVMEKEKLDELFSQFSADAPKNLLT